MTERARISVHWVRCRIYVVGVVHIWWVYRLVKYNTAVCQGHTYITWLNEIYKYKYLVKTRETNAVNSYSTTMLKLYLTNHVSATELRSVFVGNSNFSYNFFKLQLIIFWRNFPRFIQISSTKFTDIVLICGSLLNLNCCYSPKWYSAEVVRTQKFFSWTYWIIQTRTIKFLWLNLHID